MTLPLDRGLFGRLRQDAGTDWRDYVSHPFVRSLGDGTLPRAAFQRYLTQDYLFLVQFARAYALAGYKSATLTDLRAAAAGLSAIVDVEMKLHVAYCAEWGLTENDMAVEPEAMETIAYTRFVLDTGLAGDLLDLHVALAPCLIGYAEIGERLVDEGTAVGNPYAAWIAAYAGAEYSAAAIGALETLERLGAERGAEARYGRLAEIFLSATRLETAFWEMGWRMRVAVSSQGGRATPT
jgi:thiaminase/transcriptional activator TenA